MTIRVSKEVPIWQLIAGFGTIMAGIIGLGWYIGGYQASNTAILEQLTKSVDKLDEQFSTYSDRQITLERQVAMIRVQVDNQQRALDKLEKRSESTKSTH